MLEIITVDDGVGRRTYYDNHRRITRNQFLQIATSTRRRKFFIWDGVRFTFVDE